MFKKYFLFWACYAFLSGFFLGLAYVQGLCVSEYKEMRKLEVGLSFITRK